jgi:hypothetical protein
MKNWFNKNYKTIIILSFLIPIITVAVVSITHVTKWYGISNPLTWAIYLSIGIEIAALSALAAISANMGSKVYFPFGIVTLIQFIGNIYFAYSYIDINSQSFIYWVELVSPLLEYSGVEPTDYVSHKRFLSFFAGGMLPIISLTFLHMLVKFTQEEKKTLIEEIKKEKNDNDETITPDKEEQKDVPVVDSKDIIGEVSRIRLSEEDLNILENILNKKTKSPTITPEPIVEKDDNVIGEDLEELENDFFGELDIDFNKPSPTSSVTIAPEPIIEEQQSIVEETPIENEVEVVENFSLEGLKPMDENSPIIDLITPNELQIVEETPEEVIEEQPVIIEEVIEPTIESESVVEETIPTIEEETSIEEVDVEKKK